MKKIYVFLCLASALFLSSCTDLSVNEENALKADLPSDFKWEVYAEINKDVANSQIIFDVQEKNKAFKGADSTKKAITNCVNLLKNGQLAEKVYLEYAACPKQGWNRYEKCPGIYANNGNYNKPVLNANSDTIGWQCIFGADVNSENCWRGGWDLLANNETEAGLKPLKDILPTHLVEASTISFAPLKTLCMFIPTSTTASEVSAYLDNFKLNSVLVIEHYNYMGIYDGRPYKYCEQGHIGVEKTQALADKRGNYYDYGKYTFCLNESDQKIYVVK